MPGTRASRRAELRGLRAAVFGLAALVLAAAAHAAAGGALPAPSALAVLAVPVAWGSVLLARRTRGQVALVAALGVAQLGLHEAFMVLAAPGCAGVPGAAAGTAAMPGMHAAMAPGCASSAAGSMGAMSGTALATGTAMLAAHVVATVLTALLLAHGERLLAVLPGLLVRLTRWASVPQLPVPARPHRAVPVPVHRTWQDVARAAAPRRGPPRSTGAAVQT